MDKGPWTVSAGKCADGYEKVFICSDDFTHDVSLRVLGDFRSLSEKKKYAQAIADVLNDAAKEGNK
jgi:hypothetical protein